MAVRERVGLLDLTSFAKYEISGSDAKTFLQRICANRIPKREGGVALVHMLTDLGGIECEATITRIEENKYYALSGAVAETHDYDWLVQHILPEEKVTASNVTDEYGVLVLAGPRCLLYTSPSPRDRTRSRMPSSA